MTRQCDNTGLAFQMVLKGLLVLLRASCAVFSGFTVEAFKKQCVYKSSLNEFLEALFLKKIFVSFHQE